MFRTRTDTLARIPIIVALLFAISCGSDSPSTPEPPQEAPERVLTISLEASSGGPGERIAINGIPEDVDFAYAIVTTDPVPSAASGATTVAEGDSGISMIRREESGDWLVVPVHPRSPMAGGGVYIEVSDGEKVSSNKVPLDVAEVPAAPGAFNAMITRLEDLVQGWAEQQGTTVEEMRSKSITQLHPLQVNVYLMDAIVSNPENENSLRAFADGDIPLAEGVEIDRAFLDGIAGLSGLGGFVEDKHSFVDTLTVPDTTTIPLMASAARSGGLVDCINPPDFGIGEGECWKLAETMAYQTEIRLEKAGAVEQLQDDAIDAIASALTYARGAMVAWGMVNTFWVSDNIDAASTAMYPSQFLSEATDFEADPEEFDEDFTSPGHWSKFKVTATSEGWRFDKVLLDAIKKAKGLKNSGWDEAKLDKFFESAQKKTYQDYLDKVQKGVQNKVYNQAKEDLGINDLTKLEYCPQTWPGIDCTGIPYSAGTSPSLKYDSEELTYEPVEVGTTTLLVETLPVFGPGNGTGETKNIKTNRLEVFIDPLQAIMDVAEERDFFARVANGENQLVEWSIVGATKTDSPPSQTKVKTPDDPWSTPIALTAKSMSETGLRADGKRDSDPRTKTVYITYGGTVRLEVTPRYQCIAPGDTLTFRAIVSGVANPNIIWNKVDGYGSIVSTGPTTALYTGLSLGSSNAKISAEIEGVEGAIAYANVDVRECNCMFDIAITGPVSWNEQGGDIAYTFLDVGFRTYNFFVETSTEGYLVGLGLSDTETDLAPRPGDPPGFYPASVTFAAGSESWVSSFENNTSSVSFDLEEITENSMAGTFIGLAYQYNNDGSVKSSAVVNIKIRAGYWAGGLWPCN